MPWNETSPVLERKKFVEEYERGVYSVAELCRRFGISRKTGYKWLKRFDEGGAAELADRGRRPRNSPNAVEPRIAAALLSAREQRPTWGPKKLRAVLAVSNPSLRLPSVSTIASLFKRNGLVRPRRKRHRPRGAAAERPARADAPDLDDGDCVATGSQSRGAAPQSSL
jgi:putative transposase